MVIRGKIRSVRKGKRTESTFLVMVEGQNRSWRVDEDEVDFKIDDGVECLHLEGAEMGAVGQVSLPVITGTSQQIDWLTRQIGFTPCPMVSEEAGEQLQEE